MRRLGVAALLCAFAGCGDGDPQTDGARADSSAVPPALTVPADSLLLTLGDGATVWYTHARAAHGADGSACVERGLEIRRGGARAAVPLLYTREIPVATDDTTLEARLYLDCVPGDRYRIDTRTGQPTPIR
jgi:hypothetical protein